MFSERLCSVTRLNEERAPSALSGTRILELGGIGPVPFAGMLLADMGAEVIVIERPSSAESSPTGGPVPQEILRRGKRSVSIDLKARGAVAAVMQLVRASDALIEGFRPGVAERLGLGPADCRDVQPRLVYGRGPGWGADGPWAQVAAHDINFLALTGVLDAVGRHGHPPTPPLNLVGDFGGGGMLLAFGVVCGLFEAKQSGEGQTVEAAMVDGIALLAASVLSLQAAGLWKEERGSNVIDSGSHFYDAYECADGLFIAVGAIEPGHYERFVEATGFHDRDPCPEADYMDSRSWPPRKDVLREIFLGRPQAKWMEILEARDCCCTPVLSFSSAATHPQNAARGVFRPYGHGLAPAPAPRFSRTPPRVHDSSPVVGCDTCEVLTENGLTPSEIEELQRSGAIAGTVV
jgi:alpha-methylacyl-CoA racemase